MQIQAFFVGLLAKVAKKNERKEKRKESKKHWGVKSITAAIPIQINAKVSLLGARVKERFSHCGVFFFSLVLFLSLSTLRLYDERAAFSSSRFFFI